MAWGLPKIPTFKDIQNTFDGTVKAAQNAVDSAIKGTKDFIGDIPAAWEYAKENPGRAALCFGQGLVQGGAGFVGGAAGLAVRIGYNNNPMFQIPRSAYNMTAKQLNLPEIKKWETNFGEDFSKFCTVIHPKNEEEIMLMSAGKVVGDSAAMVATTAAIVMTAPVSIPVAAVAGVGAIATEVVIAVPMTALEYETTVSEVRKKTAGAEDFVNTAQKEAQLSAKLRARLDKEWDLTLKNQNAASQARQAQLSKAEKLFANDTSGNYNEINKILDTPPTITKEKGLTKTYQKSQARPSPDDFKIRLPEGLINWFTNIAENIVSVAKNLGILSKTFTLASLTGKAADSRLTRDNIQPGVVSDKIFTTAVTGAPREEKPALTDDLEHDKPELVNEGG